MKMTFVMACIPVCTSTGGVSGRQAGQSQRRPRIFFEARNGLGCPVQKTYVAAKLALMNPATWYLVPGTVAKNRPSY